MGRCGRVVLMVGFFAAGCAGKPAWPDPQGAASSAAGIADAIAFHADPEPIEGGDADPQRLSMGVAVELALRHDPSIQAAIARVRVAQAEAHQSRLLPNPVLSVVLRWPEGGGGTIVEAGLAAELLALLRRPGQIEAADHRLRVAAAEAVTAVLDTVAEVQAAYVEVRSLDAAMPILQERREQIDRLIELARRRLDAGEGERGDVTALEAERIAIEIDAAELALRRVDARLALARMIGRPGERTDWPLDPWGPPDAPLAEEAAWIDAALLRRPEIQAGETELIALGVDAKAARWLPLSGGEAGVDAERDGGWSVGPSLAVPLPIFDWGQAERSRLEARAIETAHRLTATRRAVVEQVRRAHASTRAGVALHREQGHRLIPLLRQQVREAEASFEAGQTAAAPLILAERSLTEARGRLVEIEHRAADSYIRLLRAVGGPGHAPADAASHLEKQP